MTAPSARDERPAASATGPLPVDPASAGEGVEALISRVLRIGVALSVVLMLAGLVLAVARGDLDGAALGSTPGEAVEGAGAGVPRTPSALWSAVASGDPAGLVTAGVVALVLTPLVRVLASLWAYARARDRTYVVLTLAVVALLGLSVLVGAS